MKVSVILVIYNAKQYIKPVFDSIFGQTHKDLEVIAVINGSNDGSKAMIGSSYSQVKIIDPGTNLWFAAGNNLGIKYSTGEFIQLVNQDLILEPDYVEKLIAAFDEPFVGAATGKLLRYDFTNMQKTNIIDSTGVIMSVSGRGRDRGQNQIDQAQFDKFEVVFGVSGAGPMYRRSALERVKWEEKEKAEYFDEDFVAYWEDVDLSWRLNNAGYKNVYIPEAMAYHGRTAGQAKGGYLKIWNFIKHHRKLSPMIRQLNYKNHILMYIKNAKSVFHPAFIIREVAMLIYILMFEIGTLKILFKLFRQIPKAWKKRLAIKKSLRS